MASKTINQIDNTVTDVAGGDYLPIWDTSAGKTGKITVDRLLSNRPLIRSISISITTDSQGLAEISKRHLPIGAYKCPYVLHFFNGISAGYDYFVQVLDYDGNPIANQTVTMTLLVIPDVLDVAQSQD